MDYQSKADSLLQSCYKYANNDKAIYKNLSLSVYYSYVGELEKSLDYLELFSNETNYQYWIILFLKDDPLIDNIKNLTKFKKIFQKLEREFYKKHNQIAEILRKENLI